MEERAPSPWHRLGLALAIAAFVGPLVFMLSVSLHPEGRGLGGAWELDRTYEFENYAAALGQMGDIGRLVWNTSVLTVCAIIGQCLCCSLAGYAFARIEFRGRGLLFGCVLATMLLPEQSTAIPRFLLFRSLGWVDTFAPLILPTVLGGAPFFVFLFRQAFLALPAELTEAARVDGCSHLRIWWSVLLPLVRPMLATVGIFTFLATWNDFWAPLIYLMSPENRTLTLALASFQRGYNTAVESLMAASTVVLLPCLVVYFLAQRLFLRGIAVAASKH